MTGLPPIIQNMSNPRKTSKLLNRSGVLIFSNS